MGGCCDANRLIATAKNQEELKVHVDKEMVILKSKRQQELQEAKANNAPPVSGFKIDMIPSCEQLANDLSTVKIPEVLFEDAKKLFSGFYNAVEDDDYETAIKLKKEINDKIFGMRSEANKASLVDVKKNETRADEDEAMNKPTSEIKL